MRCFLGGKPCWGGWIRDVLMSWGSQCSPCRGVSCGQHFIKWVEAGVVPGPFTQGHPGIIANTEVHTHCVQCSEHPDIVAGTEIGAG